MRERARERARERERERDRERGRERKWCREPTELVYDIKEAYQDKIRFFF